MAYEFTDNYKEEFKRYVNAIVCKEGDKHDIQRLTDDYVAKTGERPEVSEMDEISSYLIFGRKGLTNRKKSEVKNYEKRLGLRE